MRTVDDVPLDLIVEMKVNPHSYTDRMQLPERADESHPDQIARRRYWEAKEESDRMSKEIMAAIRRKVAEAEEARAALAAVTERARTEPPRGYEPEP